MGQLAEGLEGAEGPQLLARLRVFTNRRVDARAHLAGWLGASDESIQHAAARLARHTADNQGLRPLPGLVASGSPAVRWAAIESALIRGLPGAWKLVCDEGAAPRDPSSRRAVLSWLAMLGDPATHERLLSENVAPDPDLVWSWGLCGRVEAVERALALLEHEELGRLAGEVVCTIAGLPRSDSALWLDNGVVPVPDQPEATLPPLEEEPETIAVELGEASLRLPQPRGRSGLVAWATRQLRGGSTLFVGAALRWRATSA